jgi:hypothetical protein
MVGAAAFAGAIDRLIPATSTSSSVKYFKRRIVKILLVRIFETEVGHSMIIVPNEGNYNGIGFTA